MSQFIDAIDQFKKKNILVVGDVMLDRYIYGEVERISQEAPVPVVDLRSGDEIVRLGGAANVAKNVADLGAEVSLCGVWGADKNADVLEKIMSESSVKAHGMWTDYERPTTTKTRVIAKDRQLIRLDLENKNPVSAWIIDSILEHINGVKNNFHGIIVSDYAKGVVTHRLMDGLRGVGLPLIVDPKVRNHGLYNCATLITPNKKEVSRLAGIEITSEKQIEIAGKILMNDMECEHLLITRGSEGMSLFGDGLVKHIPSVAQQVFDVTGAGDTVVAVATLGIVSGLEPTEWATLANVAAGVVVGEAGTSTITTEKLLKAVEAL